MRKRKAYYTVFALRDGTIHAVSQTRKPRKSSARPRPRIDEDGVHTWYMDNMVSAKDIAEWMRGSYHSTVATCLNTKRIVRERVESRLDEADERMGAMQEQLDRMEGKMDRVLEALGGAGE